MQRKVFGWEFKQIPHCLKTKKVSFWECENKEFMTDFQILCIWLFWSFNFQLFLEFTIEKCFKTFWKTSFRTFWNPLLLKQISSMYIHVSSSSRLKFYLLRNWIPKKFRTSKWCNLRAKKMHECQKNRGKNGRHDAILRSFLNEYRWLGSSPRRASGDLEHREKKKFNLLQQKQWWKSSLTAFWSRSLYFFPHATHKTFL